MKKFSILMIVIIVTGVLSFSSQAFGQSGSKVLMIPREGYSSNLDLMIKMEVGVMTPLLKEAGFIVDIATDSGQPILGCTEKVPKVMRLSDLNLNEYSGIIMACMGVSSFPGPPVSLQAMALTKKALAEGKPVAAGANSSIVLASAGLLKGKKYAFSADPLTSTHRWGRSDPRFADAIYSGQGVVQDGLIITSGICPNLEKVLSKPDGTRELTQKFISLIRKK